MRLFVMSALVTASFAFGCTGGTEGGTSSSSSGGGSTSSSIDHSAHNSSGLTATSEDHTNHSGWSGTSEDHTNHSGWSGTSEDHTNHSGWSGTSEDHTNHSGWSGTSEDHTNHSGWSSSAAHSGPHIGDMCSTGLTCPAGGSGTVVCMTEWPDGYCAVHDCVEHGHDCPGDPGQVTEATSGSKCVLAPTAMCLALCTTNEDCRTGYACVTKSDAAGHGDVKVCFPQ